MLHDYSWYHCNVKCKESRVTVSAITVYLLQAHQLERQAERMLLCGHYEKATAFYNQAAGTILNLFCITCSALAKGSRLMGEHTFNTQYCTPISSMLFQCASPGVSGSEFHHIFLAHAKPCVNQSQSVVLFWSQPKNVTALFVIPLWYGLVDLLFIVSVLLIADCGMRGLCMGHKCT